MIDVTKMAKKDVNFPFGLVPANVAAELRQLADDVEAGRVCVSKAHVGVEAHPDEFTTHTLTLTMSERRLP